MNEKATVGNTTSANQFGLSADQQIMLDEADKFSRKELYPLAQRMDDEEWWPEDIFRKIGEQG